MNSLCFSHLAKVTGNMEHWENLNQYLVDQTNQTNPKKHQKVSYKRNFHSPNSRALISPSLFAALTIFTFGSLLQ